MLMKEWVGDIPDINQTTSISLSFLQIPLLAMCCCWLCESENVYLVSCYSLSGFWTLVSDLVFGLLSSDWFYVHSFMPLLEFSSCICDINNIFEYEPVFIRIGLDLRVLWSIKKFMWQTHLITNDRLVLWQCCGLTLICIPVLQL